jgi:hypothetical protein
VLRGGGTLRGALVLLREHRRPAFSDQEATAAAAIAQPLTRAVKRVSVRPHGLPCPPLPPGVAVVGPDGAAEAISPQAAAWFSDLHIIGGLTTEDPLPRTVLVAAAAARTAGGAQADQLARIRTKSGRWLSLAACPLRGGRVAVVLQPATTDQLLSAMAAWHELTRANWTSCTFSSKVTASGRSRGAWDCPPAPSRIISRPSTAKPEPIATKNSLPHSGRQRRS